MNCLGEIRIYYLKLYLFLISYYCSGKFKIVTFYLQRYFRYTPALFVLMIIHLSSIPQRIVSGPKELFLRVYQHNCEKYWWSVLMFIQNYVNNGYLVNFFVDFVFQIKTEDEEN